MSGAQAVVLWRRLDAAGHDACLLRESAGGWEIEGTAVFREKGAVAVLAYRVTADVGWRTRRGQVEGFIGGRRVAHGIERTEAGVWTFDGAIVPAVSACFDLDLGFTPATNLFQLRRCALSVGASAQVPVAWLDTGATTLERVEQSYQRRSATTYWYESPRFGYAALLEVDEAGFVRRYPDLWEAE